MNDLLLMDSLDGNTIKLSLTLKPANRTIYPMEQLITLDTGAYRTAISQKCLANYGYGVYRKTGEKRQTANGVIDVKTCEINGLTIAGQFVFGKMTVDVLENWTDGKKVGMVGMDILSQLTFILSHEYNQYKLTNQNVLNTSKPTSTLFKRG